MEHTNIKQICFRGIKMHFMQLKNKRKHTHSRVRKYKIRSECNRKYQQNDIRSVHNRRRKYKLKTHNPRRIETIPTPQL